MTPRTLILPVLLICIGAGSLLTTLGIIPAVDWVWTLGLAAVGVLSFLLGGLDKVTVVVGPFFLFASLLSILRQTERLNLNKYTPSGFLAGSAVRGGSGSRWRRGAWAAVV